MENALTDIKCECGNSLKPSEEDIKKWKAEGEVALFCEDCEGHTLVEGEKIEHVPSRQSTHWTETFY